MSAENQTPIIDLNLTQGIPRDFVVSDWKNSRGEYVDLSDYTAHFSMRTSAGETSTLLLDMKGPEGATDYAGIQVYPRQILVHFTADQTEAMQPLPGVRPVRGSPASAPIYKAGVYELRVMSPAPAKVPYAVIRGDVYITLGVVDDE
jgi:hypothetical protein